MIKMHANFIKICHSRVTNAPIRMGLAGTHLGKVIRQCTGPLADSHEIKGFL